MNHLSTPNLLVFFPYGPGTGYAIAPLEEVFFEMARRLASNESKIHFAYQTLEKGPFRSPGVVPARRQLRFDPTSREASHHHEVVRYVKGNRIQLAFGLDQPIRRPGFRVLRKAGVRCLVSYFGAPMSSLNRGLKLLLKRVDVLTSRHGPDHYLFESEAMRQTAVLGRGVPSHRTSVCYLGVDGEKFRPAVEDDRYAHLAFRIPHDRRLVYYSGHMEQRKGVGVIIRTARELVEVRGRRDVHFLLLGNRPLEERPYLELCEGTPTQEFITFGGYRDDIERIVRTCHLGVIASTGWDSFPRSALEMAASGLPLLVSRLQGLVETVEDATTGYLFPPGGHEELADRIEALLDDPARRTAMGQAARERVLRQFTIDRQICCLANAVRFAWRRVTGEEWAATQHSDRPLSGTA